MVLPIYFGLFLIDGGFTYGIAFIYFGHFLVDGGFIWYCLVCTVVSFSSTAASRMVLPGIYFGLIFLFYGGRYATIMLDSDK